MNVRPGFNLRTGVALSAFCGALPALAQQAAASLPDAVTQEDTGSLAFTLVKTLVVLGLVVGLAYLTLNLGLRRLMGVNAPGRRLGSHVSVLDRFPLDAKHVLVVVRAGQEVLLLGTGEGHVSLITKLDPVEVNKLQAEHAAAPGLSPFLQKLLTRKGGPPPPTA